MTRLSVIIPTLNEVYTLPGLLDALRAQTRPPDEIIVADAGSVDGTAEIARARGATVVPDGRNGPGPGRNTGARAATGDLLVFLDADVLPQPDFLAAALEEFIRRGYAVAACLIDPLSDDPSDRIMVEAYNLYLLVLQPISPRAPGYCIFVRREIHQAIDGFNEAVKLAEDHEYVQRAAQQGDFGVLTSARLPVSMRRFKEEDLARLTLKYLWCELHALAGKPIYALPFDYEFGAHLPPGEAARERPVIDLPRWGRLENPFQRLSAARLEQLDRLIRFAWADTPQERFRLSLDLPTWAALNRYWLRRLALIRRRGRPLRRAWSKLQGREGQAGSWSLNLNWLRPRSANGRPPKQDRGHAEATKGDV